MKQVKIKQWASLFNQAITPITEISCYKGHKILIKRDDLNHEIVQGNKLRKLKYNLQEAINGGFESLVTFGGAYSNHIVAVAQAAKHCGLSSIGIIRGEELSNNTQKWSQTLLQANQLGMQLHFISRTQYKLKHRSLDVRSVLGKQVESIYLIPEGGSNQLAIKGVSEIISELSMQINCPDYIFSACGTGGTLAGLIEGVYSSNWGAKVCGVPVLKAGNSIQSTIQELSEHSELVDWQLYDEYHFGGYAKSTIELADFSKTFCKNNLIRLDKTYTSKAFYAVYDIIDKGKIRPNSTIVILHTGGLQGGEF
jgi:1-aminocyclopropane-1-carboxylate deaminase